MNHSNETIAETPRSRSGYGPVLGLLGLLYALALILSCVLLVKGKFDLGVLGILLVLTLAPLAFIAAVQLMEGSTRRVVTKLDEVSRAVREMGGQTVLSDDARRVLNRATERDLLCRAIEEDIAVQNWDAALVLVKELADRFGYRQESEEFRRQIEVSRAATLEAEVSDAIAYLDGLIIQRKWPEAAADAARLQRLYPESPRVEGLRTRVIQARTSFKSELERNFLMASHEGRADDALAMLRELDNYLTPEEAEPLRELARGVIGKARENLGVRFKLSVQDRRWREAAEVGEQIIRDFPNTRMAAEVREVIDGVRARASNAVTG
jgi:hypothetical protein